MALLLTKLWGTSEAPPPETMNERRRRLRRELAEEKAKPEGQRDVERVRELLTQIYTADRLYYKVTVELELRGACKQSV